MARTCRLVPLWRRRWKADGLWRVSVARRRNIFPGPTLCLPTTLSATHPAVSGGGGMREGWMAARRSVLLPAFIRAGTYETFYLLLWRRPLSAAASQRSRRPIATSVACSGLPRCRRLGTLRRFSRGGGKGADMGRNRASEANKALLPVQASGGTPGRRFVNGDRIGRGRCTFCERTGADRTWRGLLAAPCVTAWRDGAPWCAWRIISASALFHCFTPHLCHR